MKKYDFTYPLINILDNYKISSKIWEIPLSDFAINKTTHNEIFGLCRLIVFELNRSNIDAIVGMSYDNGTILIMEVNMKKDCTIEIPYASHDSYLEFVLEVNELVEPSGALTLCVSNVPYHLKSYLVVSTDFYEELMKLVEKYKLSCDHEKGLDEFIKDMENRTYNMNTIPQGKEMATDIYNRSYAFQSEKKLYEQGYQWEQEHKRKKVFISYSWDDEEIVVNQTDLLQKYGVNCIIDRQWIDYGEKILESVMKGLAECDMAIFFVSENFKKSSMARHELTTIWNQVINKNKHWFIVKLDEVDLDSIYFGLNDYKYYLYSKGKELELTKIIKERIERK